MLTEWYDERHHYSSGEPLQAAQDRCAETAFTIRFVIHLHSPAPICGKASDRTVSKQDQIHTLLSNRFASDFEYSFVVGVSLEFVLNGSSSIVPEKYRYSLNPMVGVLDGFR
jgi:hypothetical protein